MKMLLASLGFVAVFALLPAQAASADILNLSAGVFPQDELAALSSTGNSFAVGGGTNVTGTHFAFSAHCRASCFGVRTTDISGYAVVSNPTLGEAQGHVCAYFADFSNTTEFWIVVEKGSGTLSSSPRLAIVVVDNGEPPSGTPDAFGVQTAPECAFTTALPTTVVQGNVVVKNRF